MRKVLHFDSRRDKYHCDPSVVSCFDNRFDRVYQAYPRLNDDQFVRENLDPWLR